MPTVDEILGIKIEEIAKRSAERIEEIFKESPVKGLVFATAFQPRLEELLGDMRAKLGPKETQEIIDLYTAVNKEVDELAQKLFTN